MAKRVFFSFHYQRDISRVEIVKRHPLTKGGYSATGFFNGSLEEEAKKKGVAVVKKMIDNGMIGSTVLCVLIGKETFTRRWVDYEIFRAIDRRMGVFGVTIHNIKHFRAGAADYADGRDLPGSNPFHFLKYVERSGSLQPQIQYNNGWQNAPLHTAMQLANAPPYLRPHTDSLSSFLFGSHDVPLSPIFRIYDWMNDNGYANFTSWVAAAAKQAEV